jgi:oxygen-dependent protoporphyrinogen oxidase
MRPTVAIVGGGISGLSAAFEFHALNVPFVLLERAASCGGVIRTDRVDGYTIDAGPDALLTQKPAAVDLCRELGLGDRLAPQTSRATFLVRKGRLRRLPEASVFGIPSEWRPFVTTDAFSLAGKLRMAAEVAIANGGTGMDESIASFIGRRFGREAVDYLAEPLLAGIHGGDPAQLSMRTAFPGLMDLELKYGSVIRGLRRQAPPKVTPESKSAGPFVALPNGMQELTDALIARLPAASIHAGISVEDIAPARGGYQLSLSGGGRLAAPFVFLATPPPLAARLAGSFDVALGRLCASIRTASVVTVALGYKRDAIRHPLNGTGFVLPRKESQGVRAMSWVSSKWAGRAPADRALLRAYLGGATDPAAIDRDDQALIDAAEGEAARRLGATSPPELVRVYRWRETTPQLAVGHPRLVEKIEERLTALPGIGLSASGFRGTGIADCVADARREARRLARQIETKTALTA